MPIERLSAEQWQALSLSADLYFAPSETADWWANDDVGLVGFVQQSTTAWGYTILELGEDRRYRVHGVGVGYRSRAEATAQLHSRIDDPLPPAFQK